MPKITYKASTSVEFRTKLPETVEGTVVASNPAAGVARAVREALRELPLRGWTSLVVTLERDEPEEGEE